MGAKPKLTPKQWEEIIKRRMAGESSSALGREFGVSATAVNKKLGAPLETIQATARLINRTNQVVRNLPETTQRLAFDLAQKMQDVTEELAEAAKYGSNTAMRLKLIANQQVDKIDEVDPGKSANVIRDIMMLTQTANESAKTGLEILKYSRPLLGETNDETNVITIDGGFDL